MRISLRFLALVTTAVLVLSSTGCNKLRVRDQLNKGVASYKNARYEQAIEHFKNAVDLDPELKNAKIYLAALTWRSTFPVSILRKTCRTQIMLSLSTRLCS